MLRFLLAGRLCINNEVRSRPGAKQRALSSHCWGSERSAGPDICLFALLSTQYLENNGISVSEGFKLLGVLCLRIGNAITTLLPLFHDSFRGTTEHLHRLEAANFWIHLHSTWIQSSMLHTLEGPNTSKRDALSSKLSHEPKMVGSPGKYLSSTWFRGLEC